MVMRYALLFGASLLSTCASAQVPPPPARDGENAKPAPLLYVEQRRIDLGAMMEGDKRTVEWTLENRGTADLVIEDTKATCGCTVVTLEEVQKTIPPGKTLKLKAVFNSTGRFGQQAKSVSVYSNDAAEPKLILNFTVDVQALLVVNPPGLVNLHSVQRGDDVRKPIELLPGPGHGPVEIIELSVPKSSPVQLSPKPFEQDGRSGQRLYAHIDENASIGRVSTTATVRVQIDGMERTREIMIRGDIVGDLTWNPRILDASRLEFRPGKQLPPVHIRSDNKIPFRILSATAEPLFDVKIETPTSAGGATSFTVYLQLREGVPTGPFGVTLDVRTSMLSQPVIRIPVFGQVAEPVLVDPPVILLRDDGTPNGKLRRVKLQAPLTEELVIQSLSCDYAGISVEIDKEASAGYRHLRWLTIQLNGPVAAGQEDAVLTVKTSISGAETLAIPIHILASS